MNKLSGGERRTARQRRVDWLLQHQKLWHGWPNEREHVNLERWERIAEAMRAAGLVASRTNWYDVRVPGLIAEARRQRRARL